MEKLTKKEFQKAVKRQNELYQEATARFLSKMDIDISDWLEPKEQKEYKKLYLITDGQCPFCGEEDGKCDCAI